MKISNTQIGKIGEDIASKYLEKQNYRIKERNFYCRQGEIDIIARDKDELVFIEVKTRNDFNYGRPAEAVNNIKQKHIISVAKYYLYKNNLNNSFIRFDIIEVLLKNNKAYIHQIKNAF